MKRILLMLIFLSGQICLFSQDDLYNYPEVLKSSLNGLVLVEDKWTSEQFFCSETEKFILVKQIQDRIIAISVDETTFPYEFYLNDIGSEGVAACKIRLKGADYSIVNRNNLQFNDGQVHFLISTGTKEEYTYDLLKKKIKSTIPEVIDWESVEDWQSDYFFVSPSGKYQIEIRDANLIFRDPAANTADTLISQEYDGTWSFGTGFWSEDETRFFFDNSGAVACIWELDIGKKTINKIVPDHWAAKPALFNTDQTMKVIYCLESCIMIAGPEE